MRIVYVAKHDSGGNDDEGGITHALTVLGHDVQRVRESAGGSAYKVDGDFALFHHWTDFRSLDKIGIPKVFWCFDRIIDPDPSLAARCARRKEWIGAATGIVDVGFCTDGDWVAQDRAGKLEWLPQGADERVVGRIVVPKTIDILMTGVSRGGGSRREAFVAEMRRVYGDRFVHVEKGVHGQELHRMVASARVVVAPDAPASDRYWSNRVYNTLGFGGALLHPMCLRLTEQYVPGFDLLLYVDLRKLHELIQRCLTGGIDTAAIADYGYRRTMQEHLYRHRCERLVEIVKERL